MIGSTGSENEEPSEYFKLKKVYQEKDSIVEKVLIKKLMNKYIQGSYKVYQEDKEQKSDKKEEDIDDTYVSSITSSIRDFHSNQKDKNNNNSSILPSGSSSNFLRQWRPSYKSKIEPTFKSLYETSNCHPAMIKSNNPYEKQYSRKQKHIIKDTLPKMGPTQLVPYFDNNSSEMNFDYLTNLPRSTRLSRNMMNCCYKKSLNPSSYMKINQNSSNNQKRSYEDISCSLKKCLTNLNNMSSSLTEVLKKESKGKNDKTESRSSNLINQLTEKGETRSKEEQISALNSRLTNFKVEFSQPEKHWNRVDDLGDKRLDSCRPSNFHFRNQLFTQSMQEDQNLSLKNRLNIFKADLTRPEKHWSSRVVDDDLRDKRFESYQSEKLNLDNQLYENSFKTENFQIECETNDVGTMTARPERNASQNFNSLFEFSKSTYTNDLLEGNQYSNIFESNKSSKYIDEGIQTNNVDSINFSEAKHLTFANNNRSSYSGIKMAGQEKVIEARKGNVISCSPTSSFEYLNDCSINAGLSETDREQYDIEQNLASDAEGEDEISETSINQFTQYTRYIEELKVQSNLMLNILSKKTSEKTHDDDFEGDECFQLLAQNKTKTSNLVESIEHYLLSKQANNQQHQH